MATVIFTKKQKKLMLERKKRKRQANDIPSDTVAPPPLLPQKKRPRQEKPIIDIKEKIKELNETVAVTKEQEKINLNAPIVIPSDLTSAKDVKKFRKDTRRKARLQGLDDNKLEFITAEQAKKRAAKKQPFVSIKQAVAAVSISNNTNSKIQEQKDQEALLPAAYKARFLALDCEMVGIGNQGKISALARASIVDWDGNVILDTHVKVPTRVTDYRTKISGITKNHLLNKQAISPDDCRDLVSRVLQDKILVGHSVEYDLKALMLTHPRKDRRDTARYRPFQQRIGSKYKPQKLAKLVKEHLDLDIQVEGTAHDSVQDARANMQLYRFVRKEWEEGIEQAAAAKK